MGKMNSKLTLEQVNSLILFQRRYRFFKSEINDVNTQLSFYQDSLMSMLSNLVSCNKINIYAGTNASFMIILDELKDINDLLKSVPNKISFRDLRKSSLRDINLVLFKVYKLLIKFSNHISFEN